MATITSSEFGAPLQGLLLGKNMRVTPAARMPPFSVRRSGAPNSGLGACWGWTPGGEVSLNCTGKIDSVNKNDTEFLIDCAAFTTPSIGYLRLYVTREVGIQSVVMPLIVVSDVSDGLSDQTYQLSQVFDLGQLVDVYPGAKEFNAPEGTQWAVVEAPFIYLWSPSAGASLKLTPATIAIFYLLGPGLTQATWTIGI